MQIPHAFFVKECSRSGITLAQEGFYGVGMLYLPQDRAKRSSSIKLIEETISEEGGSVLGWRDVPVSPECLGDMAVSSMPFISQIFVSFGSLCGPALERKLYITRKCMEKKAQLNQLTLEEFYICSLSSKTIVYKGMFVAPQFEYFYPDLTDADMQSAMVLVHQRYSTNTFPSWPLSQPFRYLAHNGEINTLRGNVNKMIAREKTLSSPLFADEISKLFL